MSLPKIPSQELVTFKDLAMQNGYAVYSLKTVNDVMHWKVSLRETNKSVAVLSYQIRDMQWTLDVHAKDLGVAKDLHKMLAQSKQEIVYGG